MDNYKKKKTDYSTDTGFIKTSVQNYENKSVKIKS